MAQNQQELRLLLTANVDGLEKSLKDAKGNFAAMAESIRTALAKLPKTGVMADAFKADIVEGEKLAKFLDRLAAKKTVTPRENILGTQKPIEFADNLGNKAKTAIYKEEKKAIDEMSMAQKAAYIEANQHIKANAAAVKYAQDSIKKELQASANEEKARARVAIEASKAIIAEKKKEAAADAKQVSNMITLRYAAYDVASGISNISQTLQQYTQATLGVAIAQEKAFSQIEKTQVGVAGSKQLKELRSELLTLSTQIPKTFEELTKIGMLGAQLGIATKDLAKFTDTVAKFSAATGVSVENTALAFGKLASTLKVLPEDFDKLGSSIAYVGNTSAATEEQILSTARQIGAVATAAGFSAGEVVGLASALSSLSISPEEARGVLIPTFQEIDLAVRSFSESTKTGNERLAIFSQLAGVSAEKFVEEWGDKKNGGASAVFQDFIAGLGNTDIGATLDKLGLAGIRTSKGLTAAAKSAGFFVDQIQAAVQGMKSGTFLDDSFAKTVEDVASKLDMMKNSYDNLFAAMSGGEAALGFFGIMIDIVTIANEALRKLVEDSQVGQFLLTFVSGLVAAAAAVAALVAALMVAAGGYLAFRVAAIKATQTDAVSKFIAMAASLFGVKTAATATTPALAGIGAAGTVAGSGLAAAGVGARAAAIGMRVLQAATGPVGLAILAIGLLAEVTLDFINTEEEATDSVEKFADANADGVVDVNEMAAAIKELVDQITKMPKANRAVEDSLYDLGASLKENGKNFNIFSEEGRNNMTALEGVVDSIIARGGGKVEQIYSDINSFMKAMQSQGLLTAEAAKYLGDVLDQLQPKLTKLGPFAPIGISSTLDGMKEIPKAAGKAMTALEKLQAQIEKTFKGTVNTSNVREAIQSLGEAMAENGKIFSTMTEGGRNNVDALLAVIDELAVKSNGNVKIFATSLASLKKALEQVGAPASAIKLVGKELSKLGVNAKASKDQVKQFAAALDSVGDGALLAAADAASKLESRLSALFSAVIAGRKASLELAAGYEEMADKAAEARKKIAEAKAEIDELTADRGILEYQLQIALKYGDTLRANEIRAELAKNQQAINDQNSNIADAQNSLTPSTAQAQLQLLNTLEAQANSIYAAFSRMIIQGDKTKAEMRTWVDEQTKLYYDQAIQAGMSEEEAATLAGTIKKDLTDAIKKVPKFKVDTKSANEDVNKLKKNIASITGKTVTITTRYVTASAAGSFVPPHGAIDPLLAATGGLITGPGTATSDSIPARLSNGEYVMSAAAVQAYGLDFMNSLNTMKPTVAPVGAPSVQSQSSSGMVYLSPEDRQLLRSAIDRPVNLYTDNQKIAASANAGNIILAQRGLN